MTSWFVVVGSAAVGHFGGTTMDFKLEYDASSRMFKLVDQESRILLEGDALYDLQFPFLFELSHNTSA